jgi:hypothetical protein
MRATVPNPTIGVVGPFVSLSSAQSGAISELERAWKAAADKQKLTTTEQLISSFLGGALAGSGAYTQQILRNLAPAVAGGTPEATAQVPGANGGFVIPLGPQISTNTSPVSPANEPGFNPYDQAGF